MTASSFYVAQGSEWMPTPLTRGPWDSQYQHGGPPTALLARAIEQVDSEALRIARISVSLRRPAPIRPLRVQTKVIRTGRRTQEVQASLLDGDVVLYVAQALRVRVGVTPPTDAAESWPRPDVHQPFRLPVFQYEGGYHEAIDVRLARGTWGETPTLTWVRPRCRLVEGERSTPVQRVMMVADSTSGLGPALDFREWTYVNADLTVSLNRLPGAGWIGFDARTDIGPDGVGLAQSTLIDEQGRFGLVSQRLLVERRSH